MRGATVAALGVLAAACGGAPPVAAPTVGPPVGQRAATRGATDLVTSLYEAVGRGDSDSLMTLASAQLVVFGPRRGDALGSRADALVAMSAAVRGRPRTSPSGESLQVVPATGGHSAWAFDVLGVSGGRPLAVMAVLTNADDMWLVSAAGIAATPTRKALAAELARDAVVPPASEGAGSHGGAGAAPGAAIDRFQRGLGAADAQAAWGADLAASPEAILVGPTGGEVARGAKAVKHQWKQRAASHTRDIAAGDVASGVTPDGQLAWVTAPVVRISDDAPPTPLRAFAIVARRDHGWALVALQESLALDAPGAGTPWVRKAPAPAPSESAAPVAAAPKAKVKAKAKTRKAAAAEPTADGADADADATPPPKKKHKQAKKRPPPDDDVAVRDD